MEIPDPEHYAPDAIPSPEDEARLNRERAKGFWRGTIAIGIILGFLTWAVLLLRERVWYEMFALWLAGGLLIWAGVWLVIRAWRFGHNDHRPELDPPHAFQHEYPQDLDNQTDDYAAGYAAGYAVCYAANQDEQVPERDEGTQSAASAP